MRYWIKCHVLFLVCLLSPSALFADEEEFPQPCPTCGSTSGCMCEHPGGTGVNNDPVVLDPFTADGSEVEEPPYDGGTDPFAPPYDPWGDEEPWPPGGDGGGDGGGGDGGGGETEGTDNEDEDCQIEGLNPFDLKGNAVRKVTDLRMTGREPLHWIRYNNSIPRLIEPAFGQGGSWRHNWQYELQAWNTTEGEFLLFIYPSGVRRPFLRRADGSFAPLHARYPEKARLVGERVEITTQKENTLVFGPASAPASRVVAGIYQLLTLTDKSGRVTRFDYDEDNGLLRHITNAAGNRIALYYRDAGAPCISRVETNDGRAVGYDYEAMTAPLAGRQYVTLARARYGDGTSAEYKYELGIHLTKVHNIFVRRGLKLGKSDN
jgi:YD repeat-containing protein